MSRPWVEQVKPLLGTMIVENIGGAGSSLAGASRLQEAQCIVPQLGNASQRAKSRSSSRLTNCTGKLNSKYIIACSVPCLVRSKTRSKQWQPVKYAFTQFGDPEQSTHKE
jgi:hypothetical protein